MCLITSALYKIVIIQMARPWKPFKYNFSTLSPTFFAFFFRVKRIKGKKNPKQGFTIELFNFFECTTLSSTHWFTFSQSTGRNIKIGPPSNVNTAGIDIARESYFCGTSRTYYNRWITGLNKKWMQCFLITNTIDDSKMW